LLLFLAFGASAQAQDLGSRLKVELPTLGHRNWIVVADSAYPLQIAPGIKTVYVGGDQLQAVTSVLKAIDDAPHVRPVVFIDEELQYVPEQHARGISDFRKQLDTILKARDPKQLGHEDIIKLLDEAGKSFQVLVLKTDLTLPYTSVFIRLDAGYWSADAEKELRNAMERDGK
jgi:hypothetical protein